MITVVDEKIQQLREQLLRAQRKAYELGLTTVTPEEISKRLDAFRAELERALVSAA